MKCGYCKFKVPNNALICGHCGVDFTYKFSWNKFFKKIESWLAIPTALFGLGVAMFMRSGGEFPFLVIILYIGCAIYLINNFYKNSYDAFATKDGNTVNCE